MGPEELWEGRSEAAPVVLQGGLLPCRVQVLCVGADEHSMSEGPLTSWGAPLQVRAVPQDEPPSDVDELSD